MGLARGRETERVGAGGGGGSYVKTGGGLRFGCLMVLLPDVLNGSETFSVITFGL